MFTPFWGYYVCQSTDRLCRAILSGGSGVHSLRPNAGQNDNYECDVYQFRIGHQLRSACSLQLRVGYALSKYPAMDRNRSNHFEPKVPPPPGKIGQEMVGRTSLVGDAWPFSPPDATAFRVAGNPVVALQDFDRARPCQASDTVCRAIHGDNNMPIWTNGRRCLRNAFAHLHTVTFDHGHRAFVLVASPGTQAVVASPRVVLSQGGSS